MTARNHVLLWTDSTAAYLDAIKAAGLADRVVVDTLPRKEKPSAEQMALTEALMAYTVPPGILSAMPKLRWAQCMMAGVEAWIAEDLGPQQRAERLFTAGAGPGFVMTLALEAGGGRLGQGGGLAQRHGVAGATGQFAPDDGGVQAKTRFVLGADPAGRHVSGLGLLGQQVGIEQFKQGGVAAGQACA